MRTILTLLLVSGTAFGQSTEQTRAKLPPQAPNAAQSDKSADMTSAPAAASVEEAPDPHVAVIPSGTKVPLLLAQAISTKNAREGDPVYAQTAFPFVLNDHILIPAGTYIQGKIMHTEHAGRSKKRAELLIHFTSMIYPSGYTVMLPGAIDNTPGAEDKGVKDSEGTIQQDKDTSKRVEDAAKGAAVGGTVGSIGGVAAGGLNGARIGGLAGIAGGVAWALLKHGPEVKLPVGTSIEMEIQRDVKVDASRIQMAKAQ
jgi:type IV secretion system protein VirB10